MKTILSLINGASPIAQFFKIVAQLFFKLILNIFYSFFSNLMAQPSIRFTNKNNPQ